MINEGGNKRIRAGRYVRQPAGYRAFIPEPLPPDLPVGVADPLRGLPSVADHALGRLDRAVLTLPNPDLFFSLYVGKETVLSGRIEGMRQKRPIAPALEQKAEVPCLDGAVRKNLEELGYYIVEESTRDP